MQISAAPLIYILSFVAVVVLVEGLYLTVFGKSISLNNRMSRRLALLEKNQNREQVLEQLRKEMSQHLNSKGIPLYSILANKAQKANIAFSPRQLIMLMGALSVVAYLGLTIETEAGTPVRILVGIAMGVGGIYTWVNQKAKKRMSLLEEQLPDVKKHGLFPVAMTGLGGDGFWLDVTGERLPLRGGGWGNAAPSGVFALLLVHARSSASTDVGSRPAFVL